MNSKTKVATLATRHHEQLSLFDLADSAVEPESVILQASTGKILSFGKALQQRESIRVADILRFVRDDVEHLRVK